MVTQPLGGWWIVEPQFSFVKSHFRPAKSIRPQSSESRCWIFRCFFWRNWCQFSGPWFCTWVPKNHEPLGESELWWHSRFINAQSHDAYLLHADQLTSLLLNIPNKELVWTFHILFYHVSEAIFGSWESIRMRTISVANIIGSHD